jgi:dsRNA-specific ribonuclease
LNLRKNHPIMNMNQEYNNRTTNVMFRPNHDVGGRGRNGGRGRGRGNNHYSYHNNGYNNHYTGDFQNMDQMPQPPPNNHRQYISDVPRNMDVHAYSEGRQMGVQRNMDVHAYSEGRSAGVQRNMGSGSSSLNLPIGYKRTMFSEDDVKVEIRDGVETMVYDPYNPLNRMISTPEIQTLLANYGINVPIHHFELYKRAFIHRSYTKSPLMGPGLESDDATSVPSVVNGVVIMPKPADCLSLYTKSNERLEFIGDGVLECITKFYLYKRFPKENEGFMTEKKIALVKNESIGRIAYEMGLHKWFILSKNAEEKQTRTNLKKLGCLFESFLGALFLDFNKMDVKDEAGWFQNTFLTGPGFQMAQIFVESIFEKHVNWIDLIRNDDNYKNILQVKIQKSFKVTPDYLEVAPYSNDIGYHMGVYLCLGQSIHNLNHGHSIPISHFNSFQDIHEYMSIHGRILVVLGEGKHKIKKKAEQMACENAVRALQMT